MEVKNEAILYAILFICACGLWIGLSSSPQLSISNKLKAVVTTACLFPVILFLYTKYYTVPINTQINNPEWIPSTQALDLVQSTWCKNAVAQASPTSCCMIFEYIMKLHGQTEWGSVLDAGTGAHSLSWVVGLNTTRWTAITGSQHRSDNMISSFKGRIRPEDEVIFGNWVDPDLLKGQVFDVVLADYLLGSIDGFAPYFQDKLFERLKPHTKKYLYVVGMDPLPDSASSPQGKLIIEIAKLRDACILLAGHRTYREYPLDWTLKQIQRAGFKIENVANFETVQSQDFVEVQLNVAESKIEFIKDLQLAEAMATYVKQMRRRVSNMKWGIRFGGDYVISAIRTDT